MGLGLELLLGENFGEIGTGNISRVRSPQDLVRNIKGHGFYPEDNEHPFYSFKFRSHRMMKFMGTTPDNSYSNIYLLLKTHFNPRALYPLS